MAFPIPWHRSARYVAKQRAMRTTVIKTIEPDVDELPTRPMPRTEEIPAYSETEKLEAVRMTPSPAFAFRQAVCREVGAYAQDKHHLPTYIGLSSEYIAFARTLEGDWSKGYPVPSKHFIIPYRRLPSLHGEKICCI